MKKEIIYSLKSPYRENLDVTAYRFGGSDKSAAVVGALRGNEIQQLYVCSQLVQKLKVLEENGEIAPGRGITVIPCVNYYSMNIGKRFWAMDNTDINRMFPGYDLGETTQRIADGVFEKLIGYHYGIQLASFYQRGSFIPHVKMMETGFTDKELMRLFGLQYGIVRNPRPYDTTTLNYNWQVWETKAFSVYTSETDNVDERSAQTAVRAILRFLAKTGIITHKVRSGYATEIIEESCITQIRSDCGGLFRTTVSPGDFIEAGQVLGEILNPLDGEVLSVIKSESTGIVYFKYDKPLINEKTVCFKVILD